MKTRVGVRYGYADAVEALGSDITAIELDWLIFPLQAQKAFRVLGLKTLGDVAGVPENHWMRTRGDMRIQTIDEINRVLERFDLPTI